MEVKVTANDDKGKPIGSATVDWKVEPKLQPLIKQFGEEIVVNYAVSALKVALQGQLRASLADGKTPKELQKIADEFKPGIRARGKSPQEKIMDQFAGLDEETKRKLLKALSTGK